MHAGGLAEAAGLMAGDMILEVNGKVTSFERVGNLLPKDKTQPIKLKVSRSAAGVAAGRPVGTVRSSGSVGMGRLAPPPPPLAPTVQPTASASAASTSAAAASAASTSPAAATSAATTAIATVTVTATATATADVAQAAAARKEQGACRRCVECATRLAPYPAAVCDECATALSERKTSKGKYPGAGGFTSHGWNSWRLSPQHKGHNNSSFPSLLSLGERLYPSDYKDHHRRAPATSAAPRRAAYLLTPRAHPRHPHRIHPAGTFTAATGLRGHRTRWRPGRTSLW